MSGVEFLLQEYRLAGEALFDVNIAGTPELEEMSDELVDSIRSAFATGYSFGALSVLQTTFKGIAEKEPETLIQPVKSNIIIGKF